MPVILDTYLSIASTSEGLFKDKGSRFIAFAHSVESEEEVKAIVGSIKKEYHDARHHCYAYRIGKDGEKYRANDDGEPSGSAARPILGQIDSMGLSDVLVVVVRYFGGIKLGIPGLINAYRTAAADALGKSEKITKTAGSWYRMEFGYNRLPEVMKILKEMDLPQRAQNFGNECSIEVRVRLGIEHDFLEKTEKCVNFIKKLDT